GVHWRVRAQGKQVPQPKTTQMTSALAGQDYEAVGPLAEQLGFKLRSITPWPEWWPRLPVLDSRITIVVEALPPAAALPYRVRYLALDVGDRRIGLAVGDD